MRQLLYDGPSVSDMFKVETFVRSNGENYEGLGSNYMYEFLICDDNLSYTKRKRVVKKILDSVGLKGVNVFVTDDAYMMDNYGKCEQRFFFHLSRGRNGSGDFVTVDMKEIQDIIVMIRDNGASDAGVMDVFVDPADDVSEWVITFTLDSQLPTTKVAGLHMGGDSQCKSLS